jgi:ABC-type sulfate transport system permease subunit
MENSGDSAVAGIIGLFVVVVYLVCLIVVIAGLWKVFTKAGQPGWMALIPILNAFVLIRIAGKPAWWIILFLIPVVNMIIGIILTVSLAEKFGKGLGFALGLIFLPFIFVPILGFGSATYQDAPPKVF